MAWIRVTDESIINLDYIEQIYKEEENLEEYNEPYKIVFCASTIDYYKTFKTEKERNDCYNNLCR